MVDSHSWDELSEGNWLLECGRTGVDFWDVVRADFEYCPACGKKV